MNSSRSKLSRVIFILLSLIFLIGPGSFFFYVAYLALTEEGVVAVVIPAAMGVIFIGGGIAGVISNIFYKEIKKVKTIPPSPIIVPAK
jgi:hypothetical protein